MSTIPLPVAWEGGLDELADLTNRLLPGLSPANRARTEVNPRLIRHYTTEGLIDDPLKTGRSAHYTRRHLLQLLTLRKLMGEGLSAAALQALLRGKSDRDLEALLSGSGTLEVAPSNPAMDAFLQMRSRSAFAAPAVPSPSALPPAPVAPIRPERWTRLTAEHGLELHISDAWRPPRSPTERDRLTRHLLALLDTLHRK